MSELNFRINICKGDRKYCEPIMFEANYEL